MDWTEAINNLLTWVIWPLLIASIITLVYLFYKCFRCKDWCEIKRTDFLQALATLGIFLIAVYGLTEYEGIRRPYVSLMNVEVKSNLAKPDKLILLPTEADFSDYKDKLPQLSPELKGRLGTYISASEILTAPRFIQDVLQEVLFDLHFKNTGPVGAKDCQIKYVLLPEYDGKSLKQHWEKAEIRNKTEKIITIVAEDIDLNPEQEQIYNLMMHNQRLVPRNI